MKARIFFALVAGILVAGLSLFAAEASAQEKPDKSVPPSTEINSLPMDGPDDPKEVEAFFDKLISKQLREKHLVGATVAVVKDGRIIFAKGYGYADREKRTPVVADKTLFYPGSAGKLFTWTAVMQLVEEGKIDLDADVNTYLDFKIPDSYAESITMADLMTHTSGFEEQYAALLAEDQQDVLPLREFLIRYMPERIYPPGEYFAYSNYGTALAGYIVQRVSGEPYEQYITDHILKPLSMEHSAATQPLPTRLAPDLSKGYHYRDGTYDAKDFEWISAAPEAPVHATATDMAKFMLAHLDNGKYGDARILKKSTALEMHRQQFTNDPRLPGMAYGFIISQENEQHIIWHDGESARFSTILALWPDKHTGLYVSYNTPFDPGETFSAFVDHYYPLKGKSLPQPPAGFQARADRFAGSYISMRVNETGPQKIAGWIDPLKVSIEGKKLRLQTPLVEQLYAETKLGLFKQVNGERLLTFRQDSQGRVTHLFWGPLAFFKAAWYQTLAFQLPFVVVCLALFVSTLIIFPAAYFVHRHRGHIGAVSRTFRAARWLAAVTSTLNLVLLAWLLLLLLEFAQTYVWPTGTVTIITRLWVLSVPLTLGIMIFAALAWKDRYWGVAGRLHYTLVMLAAVAFVLFLNHWNLIRL